MELALRFGPVLEPELDSDSVTAADCFWKCSDSELEMDETSVAPKLEGVDDEGWVAAKAAGAAAGMRIASTRIEVPNVRLHSMRQWREIWRGLAE